MPKKNLVIVHAHDMGRYNSAYGVAAPTPAMERFCTGASLFRDAHCAAPTCSPSRAAMLTGRTAHEAGMFGLTHRGWDLNNYDEHLAAWLGKQGYRTAFGGVQHEFKDSANTAYQTAIPSEKLGPWVRDYAATSATVQWIKESAGGDTPFFLWFGLFMPHLPFMPADPQRFQADRMKAPSILPDCEASREDMADYMESVACTDDCFDQILAALRYYGLEDNTVVILTTDHGVPLPKMKCNLTHHGTGVTLIVRDPTLEKVAPVSDALVSHLDVFPSVCELLEVPKPDWLQGHSFVPLMAGEKESIHEAIFAEVNFHAAYQPMRSVRTKRYNYIQFFDEDLRRPLSNCDHSRTKDHLLAEGWAKVPLAVCELYDLVNDPSESCNVAGRAEYREIESALRERLKTWMQTTDDPLLRGPIRKSAEAIVNTRTAIEPTDLDFEP